MLKDVLLLGSEQNQIMTDPNHDFRPKKLVTRTSLTNPSLYSLSVTSLLDPQNQALPRIYQALQQKQQLTAAREQGKKPLQKQSGRGSINPQSWLPRQKSTYQSPTYLPTALDSLQKLEKQFEQGKKPLSRQRLNSSQKEEDRLRRGDSMPSLLGFHYTRTREIKEKQAKPYNIISNL